MTPLEIGAAIGGLVTGAATIVQCLRGRVGPRPLWPIVVAAFVLGAVVGGGLGLIIQLALSAAGIVEPVIYR